MLQSAKSNLEASQRSLRLLEDQNAALKGKVDELRGKIAIAASSESDLKDKLSGMNRSLKETVAASTGLEDELNRVSLIADIHKQTIERISSHV